MQGYASPGRERLLRKGAPIQGIDAEIVGNVEGWLDPNRAGPEGVFEFCLMNPDFHVCLGGSSSAIFKSAALSAQSRVLTGTKEMLESAGMIKV